MGNDTPAVERVNGAHAPTRWVVSIVAALALAGCGVRVADPANPPLLPPEVNPRVREFTYPVFGVSVEAIAASLATRGPPWEGGTAHGLTRWTVRPTWRSTEHGGSCLLVGVRVDVSVDITLPEWAEPHPEGSVLARSWDEFREALRIHEYGHRDLAFRAAREVAGALSELSTADCVEIGEATRALVRQIVGRYRDMDVDYDLRTGRGRVQGAVWPPGSGDGLIG